MASGRWPATIMATTSDRKGATTCQTSSLGSELGTSSLERLHPGRARFHEARSGALPISVRSQGHDLAGALVDLFARSETSCYEGACRSDLRSACSCRRVGGGLGNRPRCEHSISIAFVGEGSVRQTDRIPHAASRLIDFSSIARSDPYRGGSCDDAPRDAPCMQVGRTGVPHEEVSLEGDVYTVSDASSAREVTDITLSQQSYVWHASARVRGVRAVDDVYVQLQDVERREAYLSSDRPPIANGHISVASAPESQRACGTLPRASGACWRQVSPATPEPRVVALRVLR